MPIDEAVQTATEAPSPSFAAKPGRLTDRVAQSGASRPERLAKVAERPSKVPAGKVPSEKGDSRRNAQKASAQVYRQLKSLEADNNQIQTDLKRTQTQLASLKQENDAEIGRAAEREWRLRNELEAAHNQTSMALESTSRYRRKLLAISIGFAVSVLCLIGYGISPLARGSTGLVRPGGPAAASAQQPGGAPPAHPKIVPDFSAASVRLDRALRYFGSEDPAMVLGHVHNMAAAQGISVCSFEWHNGQASLLFGAKEGMGLETAMAECADAVERAVALNRAHK